MVNATTGSGQRLSDSCWQQRRDSDDAGRLQLAHSESGTGKLGLRKSVGGRVRPVRSLAVRRW